MSDGGDDAARTVTDADLLAELERVADELGHPPTVAEMRETGAYWPNHYAHRFGSWTEALERAGLDPDRPPSYRYTKADLLAELDRVTDDLGHPPTLAEMDDHGEISSYTFRRRFGTWSAALAAAGYEPQWHDGPDPIPPEDLLVDLQAGAGCLGYTPRSADIAAFGDYSVQTYVNRFGSLDVARVLAGLNPLRDDPDVDPADFGLDPDEWGANATPELPPMDHDHADADADTDMDGGETGSAGAE